MCEDFISLISHGRERVFFSIEMPQRFCRISVFCHGCLENRSSPLGHDEMNKQRVCLRGLWFIDEGPVAYMAPCAFSCHMSAIPVPLVLSFAVLLPLSLWCMASHPLFPAHPWIECHGLTSCSFRGREKTSFLVVSLTNVFYLYTINNVAVKHVRGAVSCLQSHPLVWDCEATIWTWHSASLALGTTALNAT